MRTIIDTGPLVALLNNRDQFYNWAVQRANEIPAPFYTCEAVLAETHFLLKRDGISPEPLHHMLESDLIKIDFIYQKEASLVHQLINQYEKESVSFADACLVAMHIQKPNSRIFTIDAHFYIYRNGKKQIPIIIPN